jgi:hypothetical protein
MSFLRPKTLGMVEIMGYAHALWSKINMPSTIAHAQFRFISTPPEVLKANMYLDMLRQSIFTGSDVPHIHGLGVEIFRHGGVSISFATSRPGSLHPFSSVDYL